MRIDNHYFRKSASYLFFPELTDLTAGEARSFAARLQALLQDVGADAALRPPIHT